MKGVQFLHSDAQKTRSPVFLVIREGFRLANVAFDSPNRGVRTFFWTSAYDARPSRLLRPSIVSYTVLPPSRKAFSLSVE